MRRMPGCAGFQLSNHNALTMNRSIRMLAVPMRSIVIVALGALFSACADYQPPTAVAARAARTQSLNDLDFGVAAVDYKLTSFDLGTLTLSGDSKLVNLNPSDPYIPTDPYQPSDPYITFTASLSANTRFLAARLDAFQPQDPYCP